MPFQWQIPNNPPDEAALTRMKQHFRQPKDLMPEAWFMNGETNYFSWLAETTPDLLEYELLALVINEAAGGIIAFPEAYVDTWSAWIKYFLPYAIARSEEDSGASYHKIIGTTFTAFITVYPTKIEEEYEGFRDDVIYALGTRLFPYISSLDALDFDYVSNVLSRLPGEQPGTHDGFNLPMLFALKYLEPAEIEDWVSSLVGIPSYSLRFGFIVWWLAYTKFLKCAENWPEDGKMEVLLDTKEDRLIHSFWITRMEYESLDAFLPQGNRVAFETALAKYLTPEVFKDWAEDISSHRTFMWDDEEIPIIEPKLSIIQGQLMEFEQQFFAHKPSI